MKRKNFSTFGNLFPTPPLIRGVRHHTKLVQLSQFCELGLNFSLGLVLRNSIHLYHVLKKLVTKLIGNRFAS